ncbi:MAG: protein kinase [Steroidobacteraceae bacterium]
MKHDLAAHWDRLSPLLDAALERDPAERAAWLDALPAQDAALRPLLARLLSRQVEAEGFLTHPAPWQGERHAAGDRVGPYRLLSELGRGGMGVVWLAERDGTGTHVPVALKLPFVAGTTASVRERFERERAILAALNHPGIARLLEAGVSDDGQPFLALEFVEGEPLLAYCHGAALALRERVRLFVGVLEAVRYAHANLVIHRDLKPSNLVIASTGEVKLLDFGIAKLVDRETQRTEQTELTGLYGRPMTLDYASPEQVRGEPLTTAADVYSLGVVLYELLTGTKPYRLARGSQAELEEAILTANTTPPSRARDANPSMRRALRGDLDAIVMKALEKDTAARYASVDAFALDCARWLDGRPVLAQPPRFMYRMRKFISRNRLAFAAGALVALAMVGGTAVALWQASEARAQSHLAAEEAAKQHAVQSFLTQLFDRNTREQPDAAKARAMTVRDLLLDASRRVQGGFDDAPTVKLELLNTVARLLRDIDEYDRAAALGRDAVTFARAHGLSGTDAHVEALMGLATSERLVGHGDAAVAARDESLAVLDARGDHDSLLRARASANTVAQFAPDIEREIWLVEDAVHLFGQRYPNRPEYFSALYYLANLHRTQQRAAEAAQWFKRAIAQFGPSGSRDYTSLGSSYAFVGASAVWLGRMEEGLRAYEQGLQLLERHAGAAALTTRFQRGLYAEALHSNGRVAEAHAQFARIAADKPPGPETIADFDAAVYEASAYLSEGDPARAIGRLEPYAARFAEFGPRYVPNGWRFAYELAYAQALQGAIPAARRTLALARELPPHYGVTADTSHDCAIEGAGIELLAGDPASAARLLEPVLVALADEPSEYDALYVRAKLRAAEIDLARTPPQPWSALTAARAARAHLQSRAGPGTLPLLEARARALEGKAQHALGTLAP